MKIIRISIISLCVFFLFHNISSQITSENDILISFSDKLNEIGYRNMKGDTIIPPGKYPICYTDTFKTYAIVLIADKGIVAIDRNEKILYNVFPFDNGPDYVSEGFFRIIFNNKIGFADAETGKIMIEPKFDCAMPFENGYAKVSLNCTKIKDGDHSIWKSEEWFFIDKKGRKIN